LAFDEPKTSRMAGVLKAIKVERGALLTVASADQNLMKSVRNIPNIELKLIGDVNAYDVIRARHLVFTRDSFKALSANPMAQSCSAEA
jgi:ribosomal protein L4